jgi:hypothetical protein
MKEETSMRAILIGLGVVVAAMAADTRAGNAQYNAKWCIADGIHGPGSMECAYYTFAQCQESRRGNGGTCVVNPDLLWQRREQTTGRGARSHQRGDGY